MLTRAHRQEALSRAYIHAIAGRFGLLCGFRDYDYGIDLSLHEIRRKGSRYAESGHRLDIQAKSTTQATRTEGEVFYDLEIRTYNTLREDLVG